MKIQIEIYTYKGKFEAIQAEIEYIDPNLPEDADYYVKASQNTLQRDIDQAIDRYLDNINALVIDHKEAI